jgi:hypothetical protein
MNTELAKTAVLIAFCAASIASQAFRVGALTGEPIVYEPATDAEVAAYFAEGQPKVVCVAAETESGCR